MTGGKIMDYNEIIKDIFTICIIPLLGVLTGYLVNYIKHKTKELLKDSENSDFTSYFYKFLEIVESCVTATNQTYVEALKKEGKFDEAAQKEAFEKTKQAILEILSDECKGILNDHMGNLDKLIEVAIEQAVKNDKK